MTKAKTTTKTRTTTKTKTQGNQAACARMENLPDSALQQVAGYFSALSEPTRLKILNLLRQGEHNVGELAQKCGYTSANVSRHLALLVAQGFVARESRGTSAYFTIADDSIHVLCDFVCEKIAGHLDARIQEREVFGVRSDGRA